MRQKLNRGLQRLGVLIGLAVKVSKDPGIPLFTQLKQLVLLLQRNPVCSIETYYDLGLYRSEIQLNEVAKSFVGKGYSQELSECLNPRASVSVAWNKLSFEIFTNAYNLPAPPTLAVFREQGCAPNCVPAHLQSTDDAAWFLADDSLYPLYIKPCHSQQGIGGYLLESYHPATSEIDVMGEGRLSMQELLRRSIGRESSNFYDRSAGYLFQKVVRQHPELRRLTGTDTLSGLRVVVVRDDRYGVFIHRAVLKLTSEGNAQDNFRAGSTGNLVCSVDINSGQLSQAVTGLWPGAAVLESHPLSEVRFSEIAIPFWPEICELVLRASDCLGGMRLLHWDVACGETGPVLLEVNDLGSTYLVQATGTGILDARLVDVLKRHGTLRKAKAISKAVSSF